MSERTANLSQAKTVNTLGMKTKLSTLWIFAMLNYLYADVMTLMDPAAQKIMQSGSVGPLHISQGFLLGAAILMETAIAMVLLSRVLKYRANRWANVMAGIIHTAAVSLSLLTSTPAPYYIFFAAIEIPCTLFIIWLALRWKPDTAPAAAA
jgi:cytochrome b561